MRSSKVDKVELLGEFCLVCTMHRLVCQVACHVANSDFLGPVQISNCDQGVVNSDSPGEAAIIRLKLELWHVRVLIFIFHIGLRHRHPARN